MKKIFSKSILTAIALALFLSSCISESILPDTPDIEGYKTVLLHITQADSDSATRLLSEAETRGISRPVCNGELLGFGTGDLYFVNAAGIVVRHFRIVNEPEDLPRGIIDRRLLTFSNTTISTAQLPSLTNIPGNATRAYIIGNTPNNERQGNINDIINRQLNITTQYNAFVPAGNPAGYGVNLFGRGTFAPHGSSTPANPVFTVTLPLAPTVARFEIGRIEGTGSIADFTVEGIFIDGHYRRASISGIINHHGVDAPNPNRMDRGTNSDLFQDGEPYFSFISGSNNSGALFDLNIDRTALAWQGGRSWRGRRAGTGVPAAPPASLLRVTPGTTSSWTGCTTVGCTIVHSGEYDVWSYHVFAHRNEDTAPPRIIIRLSHIHLINGTEITDSNHPYRYVTVREFYHNGVLVNGIRAGQVYRIATVWFDESDLRYVPNYLPAEADPRSSVATFVGAMYDFQRQELRAFVTSGATPTSWQWQVSTDNETWFNINGAITPNWVLPANFIHNSVAVAHGLPTGIFTGENVLYFRNAMVSGGRAITQDENRTLRIRFVRTTHTGNNDFITPGFGMTNGIRWADINRGSTSGTSGTTRVVLLNLGAENYAIATDGGLGSLFQWGRRPDGHQAVVWGKNAGTTIGTGSLPAARPTGQEIPDVDPVTGQIRTTSPLHGKFITDQTVYWNWGNMTDNLNLWGSGAGGWSLSRPSTYSWGDRARDNNPCRILLGNGWRLPSAWEWWDLLGGDGNNNPVAGTDVGWNDHNNTRWEWHPWRAQTGGAAIVSNIAGGSGNTNVSIILPAAWWRNSDADATLNYVGNWGIYWSGTQWNASFAWHVQFSNGHVWVRASGRALGFSVRCVAD